MMNQSSLKRIYETAKAMSSLHSRQEVLDTLAGAAAEVTRSECAAVLMIDESGSGTTPAAAHNLDVESLSAFAMPVSTGNLLGRAFFTLRPSTMRDRRQLTSQARGVLECRSLRSMLAVPILDGMDVAGIILLASKRRRFARSAGAVVRILGDIAVACAARADELSELETELDELKWLTAITQDIDLEQGHEDVQQSVMAAAADALGADSLALYMLDDDRSHLSCSAAYQIPASVVKPKCEEHHAILCKVLEWEEPLVVSDTKQVPQDCRFQMPVLDINTRSILALQLRCKGRPVGLLMALYRTPGAAAVPSQELCRILSREAAAALNYSRVLEQSRLQVRDLESVNERLIQQATQDGLTGLANHRSFHQRLIEHVHRVGRYKETFSLVMIDVDHFKAYNDAYGHQQGDQALVQIARIIQEELRDSDFAARYGGEEFALILPHTPKPQARIAVDRIRKSIDNHNFPDGRLTVSAGIAECPCDGVTANEVLEKSDRALYHAKLTGRNRLCLWGTAAVDTINGEATGADARSTTVLLLENDEAAHLLMQKSLSRAGYAMYRACSKQEAVNLLRTRKFDIMLSDALVLGSDGQEVLGLASAIHPTMPIVLTTESDSADARDAMRHGVTDVLVLPCGENELPVVIERNLERKRIESQMLLEKSTGILLQAIDALVAAIDAKDRMTAGHTTRVTHISLAIADSLNLPSEERYTLELAARLHDIGKISLPDSALNKSGALTEEEWAAMMRHPAVGSQIVGAIGDLSYVATIVRHHHERLDGKGYPDGLQGEAIPLLARIIAVADAYEAMTSERSFRRQMTPSEAVSELRRCINTHYSANIVEALVESLRNGTIEVEDKAA